MIFKTQKDMEDFLKPYPKKREITTDGYVEVGIYVEHFEDQAVIGVFYQAGGMPIGHKLVVRDGIPEDDLGVLGLLESLVPIQVNALHVIITNSMELQMCADNFLGRYSEGTWQEPAIDSGSPYWVWINSIAKELPIIVGWGVPEDDTPLGYAQELVMTVTDIDDEEEE